MNTPEQISWLNANCPDGGILQSEEWRAFEESNGNRTEHFERSGLWANIIEYRLPLVGTYWYVPRGPVIEKLKMKPEKLKIADEWFKILNEAKKRGAGWVRVEPRDEAEAILLQEWSKPYRMKKALHDMQPREILVGDISGSEEQILAGMKSKTRYNVRLAEKRGIEVSMERSDRAMAEFLRMVQETARRNGIATHAERRYRNFLTSLSEKICELVVARREGKAMAAILVSFFGDTATYLHGASGNDDRDSMAPFLVQFRAIREAKRRGCLRYDMGGVDTEGTRPSLSGVTRWKRGFFENVNPVIFPGSFDIVLASSRFSLYTASSMSKGFVTKAIRNLTKK